MVYNRNIHEYTIKCYNSDFHGEGLLDTDVREVPYFIEKQKHHCMSVFRNFLVRIFPHSNQKNSE